MIKRHTVSFKNALEGLLWALRTQPNFIIHLVLSAFVLLAGKFFGISYGEFLTIGVLIVTGLSIELINTAIEAASDAIDTSWREDIKITKDVAAGAMLLFAVGSVIIAAVIFVPRIMEFVS